MNGKIEKFTSDAIENALESVQQHPEHPMQNILMGHLECMVNRLNNEELTIEQIEAIGQAAQDMPSFVSKKQ